MIEVTFDLGALVERLKAAEQSDLPVFESNGFKCVKTDKVSDSALEGERVVSIEDHPLWKMTYSGLIGDVPDDVIRTIVAGHGDWKRLFARHCHDFVARARRHGGAPFVGPSEFSAEVNGFTMTYINDYRGSPEKFSGREKIAIVSQSHVIKPVTINYRGGLV